METRGKEMEVFKYDDVIHHTARALGFSLATISIVPGVFHRKQEK